MKTSPALVRIAALWLLALMVAVGGAIIAIAAVRNTAAGPTQPVRSYIAALQAGDGAHALGLLNAKIPQGSAAMLDGAALKDSISRLEDLHIGEPAFHDDGSATVELSFTAEGATHHTGFEVEKAGREWLFFDRWAIRGGTLPTVEMTIVNASQASLNGVPVNVPGGRNTFPVLYPGSYRAALEGQHFSADPRTAVVSDPSASGSGAGSATLALETKATPELIAAIDAKMKEYLDGCAATATEQQRLQPECPFYYLTDARVDDGTIKWSIAEEPHAVVEPFGGEWTVAPLKGKARITATAVDLFSGATIPVDEVLDFSFTVTLGVSPEAITVTPVIP